MGDDFAKIGKPPKTSSYAKERLKLLSLFWGSKYSETSSNCYADTPSMDLVMIAGSLLRSYPHFQNDQPLYELTTSMGPHILHGSPCLLSVEGMQLKAKLSLVGIIDRRQQDIVQQIK